MRVGDVVIPRNHDNVLHCGCGYYSHAICASVAPFILISSTGDMRWSATIDIANFISLCRASRKIRKIVKMRLKRDIKAGTVDMDEQ